MRSARLGGAIVAVTALLAAGGLASLEDRRRSCEDAAEWAYSNARAPIAELAPAVDGAISDCPGSETLAQVSLGLLQVGRREPARTLARAAASREPASYYAWVALAQADPPAAAARAAREVRRLNPHAASGP